MARSKVGLSGEKMIESTPKNTRQGWKKHEVRRDFSQ